MGHKTGIVSVSFTTDSNMTITGISIDDHHPMSHRFNKSLASQDGLLLAWSTHSGTRLATFHYNQDLAKLLVAPCGGKTFILLIEPLVFIPVLIRSSLGRYAAILKNASGVAMVSLFNIPPSDVPRTNPRPSNLKFNENSSRF